MRKIGIIAALSLLLVAVVAVPALAARAHLIGAVQCTDIGTQLQCTGKVAGLGEEEAFVTINATGLATVECTNPGGNVAPGQTTEVTATGVSGPIEPHQGQITFTTTTETPTVGPEACPNPQWTPTVTDVEFTSATITVVQGGVTVLGPEEITL